MLENEQRPTPKGMVPPKLTLREKRLDFLTQFHFTSGILLSRLSLYDGMLVMREAQKRSMELLACIETNKLATEFLDKAIEGNVFFAAVTGYGFMVYAIAANHGRIKADDTLLMMRGYHPSQILASPEGEGISNDHNAATATRAI
jgi:hypothetical protein